MTSLSLLALALTLAADPSAMEPAEAAPPPDAMPSAEAEKAEAPAAETPLAESAPAPPEVTPSPETAAGPVAPADEAQAAEPESDPAAEWYSANLPSRVRILALPVARTVAKEGMEFILDHRSAAAIYDGNSLQPFGDIWHNLGGLDQSMAVGLGLRYGIIERVDAGMYRVGGSQFDTYELDARVAILRQEDNHLDLMVRGGVSWFVVPKHQDALWPFAQAFASRLFANRVLLTAGLMYHANSSGSTALASKYYTAKYRDAERKWSFAAAGGAELRLAEWVALDAELVACAAGFCADKPAFSGGVKFFTFRHTFALVCGNTQYLTADAYITNSKTPWSKLVLGFNVMREY